MTPNTSLLKSFLTCVATLAGQATWTFVKRLAVFLLAAMAVAVPCALLAWKIAVPEGTASAGVSTTVGIVVLLCYLAAGLVWALHRSCSAAVERVVPIFTEQSPELLNGLFDPVFARCPVHDHRIAVADARSSLQELFGGEDWNDEVTGGRFPLLRGIRRMIVRRCVRAELMLANEVLDSLEQKGEVHISAMSLKGCLQDKMIGGVAEMARAQVRSFGLASAAIAFLLVLGPVAVSWLCFG
jgi:hypothetical protein